MKGTVQFYYLIELNQFFSEQEIQSESNNSIKSSLSKAIVSVLSSSNNLSRTRRRYVHHNHHNVVGIQFPRRFLSLDANVTHDLVNNVGKLTLIFLQIFHTFAIVAYKKWLA